MKELSLPYWGTGEIVKNLPCNHEDAVPTYVSETWNGGMSCACYPSTGKAGTGGSLGLTNQPVSPVESVSYNTVWIAPKDNT